MKILKLILGLFLIFLMLSFLVPNEVISSLIESKKIINNQIIFRDKVIIFQETVYDKLKQEFSRQTEETSFCLVGRIEDNNYVVSSLYIPKTFFKTSISVSSEVCSENTIITLHTHPFNNCLLSLQDIFSYQNYKRTNPTAITGVMCSVERFSFYAG